MAGCIGKRGPKPRNRVKKAPAKNIVALRNRDGSYVLTYKGVLINNATPKTRCMSERSAKATITRWKRQFGAPDRVIGDIFLD